MLSSHVEDSIASVANALHRIADALEKRNELRQTELEKVRELFPPNSKP